MAQARKRRLRLSAIIGTVPMMIVAIGVYVIGIAFTVFWSFTDSKLFPNSTLVGFKQYHRLWQDDRWLVAVQNIWIFGILLMVFALAFGFLLAVFMDQEIRQEDLLRSIYLYPFAMSLIVTGLVWQWMLDPNFGIEHTVRSLGWANFQFSPLVDPNTAIYGLVVAGIWQGSGVTMAILLAGLRGIDAEIWKAARIDGIPIWRVYIFIVIPMMRGSIGTAFVLIAVGVVRVYDLVVAMTGGGPGISTNMPAVYVIDMITKSYNVGQGMAAATIMLLPVIAVIALIGLGRIVSTRRKNAAILRAEATA
ncbi:MAG: ABC transporter permease subunit [Limimaricola sp.]|uniref:carbohydrate ABC transporter permease n=1 Tax=Limimaricola sp. TaxID=2211665 RepID=UPI001D59A1C1|nr:sugar ABC transporter permease [Limimaricola sp.]MBI1418830.1 ABC transporter permease subunit [Limimaricola sp.]